MFRRFLSFLLSTVLACVALAGLVPGGRANAQVVAPEVATSSTGVPAVGSKSPAGTAQQRAWLEASVDERVRMAEALGEDGARALARKRGYTALLDGTERSLRQGLDQVYRSADVTVVASADVTVVAIEAKGGGSPLGRAYGFEQGTPEWAVESAKRMATSARASAAENAAASAVLQAAKDNRLVVLVVRTRHVLGEPIAAVVERSSACTAEAMRLAASALEDLARAAVGARATVTGAKGTASTADGVAVVAKPTARVLGTVAKGAVVVGLAADVGLRVHSSAEIEDRFARGEIGQKDREVAHARNAAGMVGGWGGAWGGMELGAAGGGAVGAAFGGVGAPFGAAAGAFAGGVAGYFGGEAAAEATAGWAVGQVHAAGTTISGATGRAANAVDQAARAAGQSVSNAWFRATGW